MNNNIDNELAVKYLKLREQQRIASKKYYDKNSERLIKASLDRINNIKSTDEFKEKKARWNQITVAKTKAKKEEERASNPNARARGRPLKIQSLSSFSEQLINEISSSSETSSESLSDVLKRFPYRPEEIAIL